MGYPASKTYAVLNSLDTINWSEACDGNAVRKEFQIKPDVPVLAIISRLFPWKGHTELLKALALAKTQVPNFKLLVVGEDDPRATPGRESFNPVLQLV